MVTEMKKTVIMILAVAIFVITSIVISVLYINNVLDSLKFKTEDEIISLFEQNKKEFVNSARKLKSYQSHWSIRKEPHNSYIRSDWKSQKIRRGLYVIVHEEPYDELSLIVEQLENNNSVFRIIKKLNFKLIGKIPRLDKESIYFVKQTSINYEAGIVYSPNRTPTSQYIRKLTEIEDGWYYYESK